MTLTPTSNIQTFLARMEPFDRLSDRGLAQLVERLEPLRYRMGQPIILNDALPGQIAILYQGQARLIAPSDAAGLPDTLERLEAGAILGWISHVRQLSCELAIASTEAVCLVMDVEQFEQLWQRETDFAQALLRQVHPAELHGLLQKEADRRAWGQVNLAELVARLAPQAVVHNFSKGKTPLDSLDPTWTWLLSCGQVEQPDPEAPRVTIGQSLDLGHLRGHLRVKTPARLIGVPPFQTQKDLPLTSDRAIAPSFDQIPYAPERPPAKQPLLMRSGEMPLVSGKGEVESCLACFQMLAQYFGMPFRRDVLRRTINEQYRRVGSMPLQLGGAIGELMGLKAQLAVVPADAIGRLQGQGIIRWQERMAVLYQASDRQVIIASPEKGLQRLTPKEFAKTWGDEGEILLLEPTAETPRKRFGISWFLPSVVRYRRVLTEVLLASFFVQLLGLANPLITQVIIDKVINQNSPSTLNVLGSLLIGAAIVEALLTALRTNLFVDTTNRIDMTLGTQVIDHLLRLPLRYFEKRPVGELSTRVNELENIRQFLTGTALTVVLDSVFSVIYIGVMIWYSPLLTIVALATVPLFAMLTLMIAPIMRQQSRFKAERNAQTQSYLVEVMSGIQTVKAQNIELPSRWTWQDKYAKYVMAGFKNVQTSTAAGGVSQFLSQLSNLLLLWVGAFLVLENKITLGQLIAFRIIAGYTTSPLLRLIQLWQNFQETALSLERLADILDTPQETSEADRANIPMPAIKGAISYDNITFRFAKTPKPQLDGVTVDIAAGSFVGIVGQSGAGKSTLTKLIPRLYDPEQGRILIDGYDIHKVELYSLRRQIGMVLQDTLLFDTTVQENIALTNPDATPEEVVEAARVAFAHDFIMELPQGYNSAVGERGSALSGGQRQRIAIARTVLQNPNFLILDEATSALDYNSERQVCMNLQAAFKGRTVLFITHRLATIRSADVILMMDQGRVAEQGSHEELMAMQGLYYCLYQQQEASGSGS
jgi:ATP-binding cassette, subfamily B, bacterial HlyB/CyaB